MRRDQLVPNKTATYVLPHWKTVYVSVPKAACTSLKWLVADLQGEDPEHFYRALSRETGRQMTIHHRARWQHTPMLHELSDGELDEIHPDNGWFVFAVVRHPAARLWSGWQSKMLLREPYFRARYTDAPWPRVPQSTDEVVEDFHEFVRALGKDPKAPVFHDRHFRSQTRLLKTDRLPYSRVYKTAEMGRLLGDLTAHLEQQGLDSLPELRRSNETPLLPVRALFTEDVLSTVASHYAKDFEQFDYPDLLPDKFAPADEYSADQLAEIGRLVERAERIGDLFQLNLENRRRVRMQARELRAARREAPDLAGRRVSVRRLVGRATRSARARLRRRPGGPTGGEVTVGR